MTVVIPTKYTYLPDCWRDLEPVLISLFSVNVELTNYQDDRWAVRVGPQCLDEHGNIDMEPIPSSRSDEWLAKHRFSAVGAAKIAMAYVDSEPTVNGRTARDYAAMASPETEVK